jgi:cell division protein FtsL
MRDITKLSATEYIVAATGMALVVLVVVFLAGNMLRQGSKIAEQNTVIESQKARIAEQDEDIRMQKSTINSLRLMLDDQHDHETPRTPARRGGEEF